MKALTSFIFMIIAVGLFFWYVEPTWATIQEAQAQISQFQGDITAAQQAQKKIDQLTIQYNGFDQSKLQQIQDFLPASVDPIKFALSLNTIAASYGGLDTITVGSVQTPSDSATTQQYSVLPVTFSVSMTYSNFLLFLKDIERSLPPTDVTSLSFTPPTTGDIYTFTVGVQTYYLQ